MAADRSAQPMDVLEALAAWANEKDVGMAEWKRRAGIVDAVSGLVDKAETAAQLLHNAIAARQIGEGYQSNLDDLNAALARVQGGAA